MRISTLITLVWVIAALYLAVRGFFDTLNSEVTPTGVALEMFLASALFAGLAVYGLSRRERWQRFIGVSAVAAAVLMFGFAFFIYYYLRQIVTPY